MADFYPILARAIAGLPDKSLEARRSVYDRAKTALLAQLRGLDPPLSEAEITRERLALDEAVARIEAELAPAPPSPPPRNPDDELPPLAPPAPADMPEAGSQADGAEPPGAPAGDETVPALPAERPRAPLGGEDGGAVRPRVEALRRRRLDPRHIRTAIVGSGVAIAVLGIAAAAYYVNKVNPPQAARTPAPAASQTASQEPAGKINERIAPDGTTAPAPPVRQSPSTPAQQQPGSDIAIAQRALLYIEVPESPQQPRTMQGRVVWRLDSDTVGQGQPVETIVRATIDVPEAGMALDFTIRRNIDTAFPASHIIGMRFTRTGADAADAIREVGVPQFKVNENERGAPLSAISSALGDNLFVAALSNVPVEVERNLDLMLNRGWIDIPVRFAGGRRGIVTFEKGTPGTQTMADAFSRWR